MVSFCFSCYHFIHFLSNISLLSSCPFDPWQSISIGLSFFRSLFALEPINRGDCIMEVPYDVQLTEDKLPGELCMLLDGVVDDTAKVAVLLMMVQHLGHESGWGPYAKSLPCKDQMHNLMFWDLNELHMVQNSSIYKEVIEQKDQAKKEFLAIKPVCILFILERFPHLFGEVSMEGFMHASALDFLNHDGFSNSILLYDEQKDVSELKTLQGSSPSGLLDTSKTLT
ncbi:hypothetical protein PR202_ga08147 [Eleusine coracana subsp. coracana]|uniref:Uncharacterized protein n=1 Tax=Eleusine coracana subsp. coracana TaxID=191504 RepID=A0AAV5BZI7_ELECO|nr:hypothetical protein PR202_ga08147 [Eleusine coracana subsp. coracana]